MKNIVICGGHLSPALAVIEQLGKNKDYKVFYFGRKNALEGDKAYSLEYLSIKKMGIPFHSIITARLQRAVTIYTLPSLFKLPIGILQSFLLLLAIRPKVIMSFGGYLALPVCLVGWCLRIPIITHEQTHYLGLANKVISKLAQVLCLSYKETAGIPSGVKTQVTGNPIRKSLNLSKNKKILDFGDKKLPLIYITGGNLGSRIINNTIGKILPTLCTKFRLLHQVGNANNLRDFKYLSQLRNTLPTNLRKNYSPVTQVDPSSVGVVLTNASIIIGRAGANTVNEILAFGLPAILIPLPWAGQNEQEKNAAYVKEIGLGEIIKQNNLTPEYLLKMIDKITADIKSYKEHSENAQKLAVTDGAYKITKLLNAYCV